MKATTNTTLPLHTRKEVIFGYIIDLKRNRNKGFTKSTKLQSPPNYGYMVGTGGEFDANKLKSTEIRSKINQLFTEAEGKSDLYIGGWLSPEDEVVIELSEWCFSKDNAVIAGEIRNQHSIWDLHEGKEIKL